MRFAMYTQQSTTNDNGDTSPISRHLAARHAIKWQKLDEISAKKTLKTSDFSGINIRTFEAKPRMFALKKSDVFVFPPEKCPKTPEKVPQNPNAPILRYFRARMVSVTSEGLLGALSSSFRLPRKGCETRLQKIAHSTFLPRILV